MKFKCIWFDRNPYRLEQRQLGIWANFTKYKGWWSLDFTLDLWRYSLILSLDSGEDNYFPVTSDDEQE